MCETGSATSEVGGRVVVVGLTKGGKVGTQGRQRWGLVLIKSPPVSPERLRPYLFVKGRRRVVVN